MNNRKIYQPKEIPNLTIEQIEELAEESRKYRGEIDKKLDRLDNYYW